MGNKLKLEDLKIGMKVSVSDLNSISNTYILLRETEVKEGEVLGLIDSILFSPTKDAQEKVSSGKVYCVYNDKIDVEGDIYYEE